MALSIGKAIDNARLLLKALIVHGEPHVAAAWRGQFHPHRAHLTASGRAA